MFIPNPWSHFPSTRCVCKPSDAELLIATRGDLEIPDGTTEAILTPVRITGRGGKFEAVGASRIWSDEFGLLDIEDHAKKVEIKEEDRKLQQRREVEILRAKEEKAQLKRQELEILKTQEKKKEVKKDKD